MGKHSKETSKFTKTCILIAICVLIIATIVSFILRYHTEGEKNLPFEIKNIRIVSTAQGNTSADNVWDLNVLQKNDLYFYIEKNENYSEEDSISKVSFENFKFEKKSDIGTVNIYKPSANTILYNYTDEYKVDNEISYIGALSTNIPSLEIGNQGGTIGFSIALEDLGVYTINENADTIHDGTLLANLNLTQEDISMKVSFDIIIETSSKNKFKATLNFDLPTGNIIESGRGVLDKNDFNDIVFKRF